MGYSRYTLPDGREAGYAVDAECDDPSCSTVIDRGLGFLCGRQPYGWNDVDAWGCAQYYCGDHMYTHDCGNPACAAYSDSGQGCDLAAGHEGDHFDYFTDKLWPDSAREDA